MKTSEIVLEEKGELAVLVVGNNPTELGFVFEALNKIRERKILTEIAFDIQSILDRLVHFTPEYIVIDDNIGKVELRAMVNRLLHSKKTRHIPITVLKNSNYLEAINTDVMNYVLKQTITAESLYMALVNSLRNKKTQQLLLESYAKRKRQLLNFFH